MNNINFFTGLPMCTRCSYCGCPGSLLGHFKFKAWLWSSDVKKRVKRAIKSLSDLDYSKIEDVELDGIDTRDYPDFCDAFILSATYKGREMNEKELERLNEDQDYLYEKVLEHIY